MVFFRKKNIVKKKLKELKDHRDSYHAQLLKILKLYDDFSGSVIQVDDVTVIPYIVELIDLHYLNFEAFKIVWKRNNVEAVYYNGKYPLTDKGITFIKTGH